MKRLVVLSLLLLTFPLVASADSSNRPNVLLIVSDDQGYSDLGCLGLKPLKTPTLDSLAATGVRGTNFYMAWPACTPSRASLITGRYPPRNGLYDMVRNDLVNYGHKFTAEEYAVSPEMTIGLDPREETFGDLMQRAGYRTGMVGKWDMGQAKRYLPLQRGFQFFYGHGNNGIDYYTHERYGVPSMFEGNQRTTRDKGVYATYLFRDKAKQFLESVPKDSPWFLYLCFNAPHSASSFGPDTRQGEGKTAVGVQVPDEFRKPYIELGLADNLARYSGAVECMDQAIGSIREVIRARGDESNTLTIFMSDNGGSGNGGNAPLRGHKSQMWEGGLRVPFIAHWPDGLPSGKVTDEFLTSLEIFPTLEHLANAQHRLGNELDGFNCLPILRGEKASPRTEMFWERRGDRAARVDNWKWVKMRGQEELFDLSKDLSEKHDLSESHPEVLQRMRQSWETWRETMNATEPRGPFRDY